MQSLRLCGVGRSTWDTMKGAFGDRARHRYGNEWRRRYVALWWESRYRPGTAAQHYACNCELPRIGSAPNSVCDLGPLAAQSAWISQSFEMSAPNVARVSVSMGSAFPQRMALTFANFLRRSGSSTSTDWLSLSRQSLRSPVYASTGIHPASTCGTKSTRSSSLPSRNR